MPRLHITLLNQFACSGKASFSSTKREWYNEMLNSVMQYVFSFEVGPSRQLEGLSLSRKFAGAQDKLASSVGEESIPSSNHN